MEQEIKTIIKQRIRGPLFGIGFVMVAGAFAFGESDNKPVLALIVGSFVIFFIILSLINFYNYPTPKSYYRTFNKIFYIWLARLVMIGLIFDIISNVKNYNPLRNTSATLPETLLNIGMDVGGIAITKKQIGSAKFIELYYKQRETAISNLKTPNNTTK